MAEKKTGKTYELKDKETSFFDDQTGLTVTRDERVMIGDDAGMKTMRMIAQGGLIEVKGEPAPPTGSGAVGTEAEGIQAGDVLPDDFPARDKLEAAGYTTLAAVNALSEEQLQEIEGIGKATAEKITQALK